LGFGRHQPAPWLAKESVEGMAGKLGMAVTGCNLGPIAAVGLWAPARRYTLKDDPLNSAR
jgi:hypothetical protein